LMSNLVLRSLVVSPAVLGLALASSATAQEADTLSQINQYVKEGARLSQVRSVNQLSDVKPTDWAYQALRSLVERYGCIAGYPDSTFRGNRAMTRYEFAAGLNACLDTVNELIASATADLATQEDLLVLQRLQEEFQAELATLRGRVDALEARTAELEANQFSTTTKLAGEVIFSLQDEFGTPDTAPDINTTFGGRVRLNLTSSFSGSDKLRVRLEAENIAETASTTIAAGGSTYASGLLEYAGVNPASTFNLDDLWYSFKPTEKSSVLVGTHGVGFDLFVPTMAWDGGSFFSNVFDDTPVYDTSALGAGMGGNYQFNDNINLTAGFLSNTVEAEDPASGVFIDNWAGVAQLTGTTGNFEGALAVVYEYGENGIAPFGGGGGTDTLQSSLGGSATSNVSVGLSTKYKFSPRFILSAFGAVSFTDVKDTNPSTDFEGDATSYTAGVGFILPDLFREGNTGGIAIGIPPTVSDSSASIGNVAVPAALLPKDNDTPLIVDFFYDFKVSDNISIIPGGIVLFNGDGGNFDGNPTSGSDDTVFVGAIKTKFTF